MAIESTYPLSDGRRLRVRLPQPSDRPRVADLHDRLGVETRPLDLERVLRFDPRRRLVAVALVQDGARETLTAYAAIDLGASTPDLLVADEALAPGAKELLGSALRTRAAARRAA